MNTDRVMGISDARLHYRLQELLKKTLMLTGTVLPQELGDMIHRPLCACRPVQDANTKTYMLWLFVRAGYSKRAQLN